MSLDSVIDQFLVSGKITNQTFTLATDEVVELFTGAPNRGHIPVTVVWSRPSTTFCSQRKPWIDKANWVEWRDIIESKLEIIQEDDRTALWLKLVKIVLKATDSSIPFKTIKKHSKTFWNDELKIASDNLRYVRKKFKYHSNRSKGAKLDTARDHLKMLLSEHSSKWLSDTLMELGHKKGKDFWRLYSRFLKREAGTFRAIKDDNEKHLCSPKKIAGEFFRKTYLEGRHLQQETFKRVHEAHANAAVASSSFFDTSDNDPLSKNFSGCELVRALRNCSRFCSLDNDQIYPKMLKKVGAKFIEILLRLFNMCLRKSLWPWNISRVIFMKKADKKSYDVPSSYWPLSIASHIG